jgi:hypothetical protein
MTPLQERHRASPARRAHQLPAANPSTSGCPTPDSPRSSSTARSPAPTASTAPPAPRSSPRNSTATDKRLIGDPQPLAQRRDRVTLRLKLLRLSQLRHDLLRREPLPPTRPAITTSVTRKIHTHNPRHSQSSRTDLRGPDRVKKAPNLWNGRKQAPYTHHCWRRTSAQPCASLGLRGPEERPQLPLW